MADDEADNDKDVVAEGVKTRSYRAKPYMSSAARKKERLAAKFQKERSELREAKAKVNEKKPTEHKVRYTERTVITHIDETGNVVEDGEVPAVVAQRYKEKIEPVLLQLTVMASNGATNDELASFLEMSRNCFDSYRKQFPALQASLDMCRKSSVEQVANSLYMAARGYQYMERKVTKSPPDEDGNVSEKIEEWTKWKAPDTTAGIFILTNREPGEWKRNVDPNALAQSISLTVGAANMSETVVRGLLQRFDAGLFDTGGTNIQEAEMVPADEPQELPPEPVVAEETEDSGGDW